MAQGMSITHCAANQKSGLSSCSAILESLTNEVIRRIHEWATHIRDSCIRVPIRGWLGGVGETVYNSVQLGVSKSGNAPRMEHAQTEGAKMAHAKTKSGAESGAGA